MTDAKNMNRQRIPDAFELTSSHSGFGTHVGPYHVAQIEGDDGSSQHWTALKVDERHGGRGGGEFGHGGMLMALLDEVMGRCASRAAGKVCATVSMQTNFCAPFYDGDFLRATAKVARRGRNLVFVDGKVLCADALIGTASGVWINTGQPLP
jgi:uncharacterized protein (TIGR00369 family)